MIKTTIWKLHHKDNCGESWQSILDLELPCIPNKKDSLTIDEIEYSIENINFEIDNGKFMCVDIYIKQL